ncbi:SMI1/KNR4 family protein [uncultured Hymenobacter sp.]|uniref:SMI1/KNR4 family protein n=1 Tax=uncultured Hymenobacter sp. TaxID=170016 RepID=UPI0035CACC26
MTIHKLLSRLKANLKQTDISLYPVANEQLIKQFEQEMRLVLPTDFKIFYLFCNGFESAEDMFRMIPLEEILEYRNELPPKQFYLAEYSIYCGTWEVEIGIPISDHYQIFDQGVVLTSSLAAFINRFLQGGVFEKQGLHYWQDEVRGLTY